ncbi:MAG: CU044_2847 family protein [Phycisphaerales bacterium]
MATVIEFGEAGGRKVRFACVDSGEGVHAISTRALEHAAHAATRTLAESLSVLGDLVGAVQASIAKMDVSKTRVEFSLAVGSKGDFYVIQGEANAALKVTVEFTKDSPSKV